MKDVIIRPLKQSDIKKWVEYYYQYYDEIKSNKDLGLLLHSKKPALSKLKSEFRKMYKGVTSGDSIIFVVETNGKFVGECHVTRQSKGVGEDHASILSIAVNKHYRAKGIGKLLMEACIKRAKNEFDIITLYVFKQNKAAINLYKKFGFVKIGMWPKAIKRNGRYIDDVIMQLDFSKRIK